MTWEYAVIGLIVGFAIGVFFMRLGNDKKVREQALLQNELEKSKEELDLYRQELVNHFARSAELLKNMANDYQKLHEHMVNSSSRLLPALPGSNQQTNPIVEHQANESETEVLSENVTVPEALLEQKAVEEVKPKVEANDESVQLSDKNLATAELTEETLEPPLDYSEETSLEHTEEQISEQPKPEVKKEN